MKQDCPHCGNQIEVRIARSPHYLSNDWTTLASSSRNVFPEASEESLPRYSDHRRGIPVRPASKEADVWVPFLVSGITSVACSIISFCFAITLDARKPVIVALLFGSVGFMLPWLALNWYNWTSLLRATERITGRDLDGDGNVGKPQPRTWRVEVETETDDGWSQTRLPCPVGGFNYLRQFAKDVLLNDGNPALGVTFSEDGAKRSGGYPRELWKKLRDVFLAYEWCNWRNDAYHEQGVELTRVGKCILKKLASGENIPI